MLHNVAVSIIIPVYNVERWVEKALRSALDQSFTDIEIICINDASRDKSWEIVQGIANEDERVRLLDFQKNHGLSYVRNRGMEKAGGKYILFLDSDDELKPDAVQRLYQVAEAGCCDLVFYGFEFNYENEVVRKKHLRPTDDLSRFGSRLYEGVELFVECERTGWPIQTACSCLFKKEFLLNSGIEFCEGIVYEDVLYINQCLLLAKRVRYLDIRPYVYYIRDRSITSSDMTIHKVGSHFIIAASLIRFFFAHDFPQHAYPYIGRRLSFYSARPDEYQKSLENEKEYKELSFGKDWLDKAFSIYSTWQDNSYKLRIEPDELEQVKKADSVIVYGAGKIGREVIRYLALQQIDDFIVAVTKAGEGERFVGTVVRSIHDVHVDKNKAVVLLSVSRRYQAEIKDLLAEMGYKKIIEMV